MKINQLCEIFNKDIFDDISDDILKVIINHCKIDINKPDKNGFNPLFNILTKSEIFRRKEIERYVKIFIDAGANLNIQSKGGWTLSAVL